MTEVRPYTDLRHFLFEAPLYAQFRVASGKFGKGDNLRGYCPECKEDSIFKVLQDRQRPAVVAVPTGREVWTEVMCRCVQKDHILRFSVRLHGDVVDKWGQYPSSATLAQGELKSLKKALSKEESEELARAVGLAAHGVGIGSFVYIRRIFERIIERKFAELRADEGWAADALKGKRMDERIELMSKHLPKFMVENKRLYAILSLGLHELKEQDCLNFFPVAYSSIEFILDDALRSREESAERKAAENAIANYHAPGTPAE